MKLPIVIYSNFLKAAAMLLLLTIGFSPFAQAAPAAKAKNSFDHSKTGFILKDVHATLKCEQCHVDGIFKNTPKDCAGCHSAGTRVAATPRPINHVPISNINNNACDTCHTSTANFLVKSYQHVGITGNCSTCHNGQSLGVVSKPATHFPTMAPCEYCHKNTSTFLSYQVDHLANGFIGNCYTCHGGPQAGSATYPNVVAYPSNHMTIAAGSDCNACHQNYVTFLGATFGHTPGSVCTTCHLPGQLSGVVSINYSTHIPLPAGSTCTSCHADPVTQPTPTFLGAAFHTSTYGSTAAAAGTCTTCHSGSYISQNAQTKGATHIPTSADCSTCHTDAAGTPANTTSSFTTFLGAKFHLTPSGNPPTGLCSTCHNGGYASENALGKNTGHLVTTADCVMCHTATNTISYTTFLGASFDHNVTYNNAFPAAAPASPLCGSCHNGATATGKKTTHVPTTGDCITCHTNATTGCPNCVSFYGVQYDHTNAAAGVAAYTTFPVGAPASPLCSSCHNGTTALGMNAGHIPVNGADCITCHTPANTGCGTTGLCSTFLGATFSHAAVAAGSCGACHQSQYPGVVSINPAIHIPQSSGNACDKCHTNAITGLPGTATPTFLNVVFHQNALGNPPAGLCSTCHSGAYVTTQATPAYSKAYTGSFNHVATTADCVVCHTAANTSSYTTFLGAGFTHSPGTYATWPPTMPPSPTCSSCHNGVTATGTSSAPTPHPAIGASDCMTCHTTSVLVGCPSCSSFGMAAGVVHNTAPYNTAGSCSTCHNGAQATGLSLGHIPVGAASCDQCHSVYDGSGSINFSTAAISSITVNGVSRYGMKHSAVTGRCDSCHNGSYIGQGIFGALAKVSNHIPTAIINTAANTDCTSCHSTTITIASGAGDWKTGEHMNHNNAQGGAPNYCVTCHLKGVTYLSTAQKISHNGASTSKDCSSSSCHKPLGRKGTAYSSWN
ncbi:cytochrome c3 family protein [Sideroxydans lithotrophicus]|nr:cytochrome c3 family protein [Sideroxydans lithotrophicus]